MTSLPTLIDTHCHLQMSEFDNDRADVMDSAVLSGVSRIVIPGIDLTSSRQAVELAAQHDFLYASVGIHPHEANSWTNQTAAELQELASHPKVVAVGEIGLDYFREHSTRADQLQAFHEQMRLARQLDLPVIIHNREATPDVLHELELHSHSAQSSKKLGVLHAFSAGLEDAREAIRRGFMIGIGGPLTYKNSSLLRELVSSIGLDSIVLETDSPYMAPHPHRGKRNQPGWISYTAEVLAACFQITIEQAAKITTGNANGLFQLTDE